VVVLAGLALAAVTARLQRRELVAWRPVAHDIGRVVGSYVICVGLFYLAFQVFGMDNVAGLFFAFAGGLLIGVGGPVLHVAIAQRRPLSALGLTRNRLVETLALALLLAGVQVALTFPKLEFGPPDTWLPLLAMAVVVGFFEAMFFRCYVIAVVEPMFGIVPAVGVSAGLYAAYHVGYGMRPDEMVFLFGLGVVYVVAYVVVRSILVIWPLLTPLGGFYNTMAGGEIEMPLIAVLGFVDILAVMAAILFLAARWIRKHPREVVAGAAPV
jgi:membrane protease YdiL (CAAX protease family)